MYDELAHRILRHDQFWAAYQRLLVDGVRLNLGFPTAGFNESESVIIGRLAETAGSLACATEEEHKELAYRLAYLLATQYPDQYPGLRSLARLVFSRIGNIPATDMLEKLHGNVKVAPPLPTPQRIEALEREHANSVVIGGRRVFLTDFQADVLNRLRNGQSVSISAPTSAGKTFILTKYVADRFAASSEPLRVIVIVPSRALIRQTKRDLDEAFSAASVGEVAIVTAALKSDPKAPSDGRKVYVLTQERLQMLLQLNADTDFRIDLMVVDEAQKLNDDQRGIILEKSVLEVLARSPNAQVVFIAPRAKNPESLIYRFALSRAGHVATSLSPVSQNELSLSIADGVATLTIHEGGKSWTVLENMPLPPARGDLANRESLMAYAGAHFGAGGFTIMFCNTTAETEKVANSLQHYLKPVSSSKSDEINEFIRFLKDYVHQDYYLVDCLRYGVAFHYGDMPDVVRNHVEALFRSKQLGWLCCTSTLLEGVNLPATNIFTFNPLLGRKQMEDSSYWNLVGRAGRLMNDFAGNVFCINMEDWTCKKPAERERTYELRSSLERAIASPELQAFIRTGVARNKGHRQQMQQAVSFLLPRVMEHGRDQVVHQLHANGTVSAASLGRLQTVVGLIEELGRDLRLPLPVLKQNSSVDPRSMEVLRRYLLSLDESQLDSYIPLHPLRPGFNENLKTIFRTIEDYLVVPKPERPASLRLALLATKWIHEESLKELIINRMAWARRDPGATSKEFANECIRNVMADLNTKVRFEFVKFLKCYIDVFKSVFSDAAGMSRLEEDLPGFLEIGAYRRATLTFINLGLTRSTSIYLTRHLRGDPEPEDAVRWLRRNKDALLSSLPAPFAHDLASLRLRESRE